MGARPLQCSKTNSLELHSMCRVCGDRGLRMVLHHPLSDSDTVWWNQWWSPDRFSPLDPLNPMRWRPSIRRTSAEIRSYNIPASKWELKIIKSCDSFYNKKSQSNSCSTYVVILFLAMVLDIFHMLVKQQCLWLGWYIDIIQNKCLLSKPMRETTKKPNLL